MTTKQVRERGYIGLGDPPQSYGKDYLLSIYPYVVCTQLVLRSIHHPLFDARNVTCMSPKLLG